MKLLILDKDGTLVVPKSGGTFVSHPGDQEPLLGVRKALAHYKRHGWTMAITSNQGGVAAGHKSFNDCIAEMRYCLDLFPEISETYFCPDYEGEQCVVVDRNTSFPYNVYSPFANLPEVAGQFRKPNPGMLKLAQCKYSPTQTWYIGDRPEDESAAANAQINFLWADTWRNRFLPGMHSAEITPAQIEFLEGIKL